MNAVSAIHLDPALDRRLAEPEEVPVPDGPLAFSFRGVAKDFGAGSVLAGIDLSVTAGQFVAVVGKSGCGKSTLLRLLAGLETATSGTIAHPNESAPARIRMMFQEPRLLPWANVLDNVAVGLTGLAPKAEARERAQAMLAEVGLVDRAGEWPTVLSGGQRQRVALARALVGQPDILALDEPLGALDALTRIEMQRLLERIWLNKGFTALLVTHDVAEAVALADRVVVIDNGRIDLDLPVAIGRPRRPSDPRLARLAGRILDRLLSTYPRSSNP